METESLSRREFAARIVAATATLQTAAAPAANGALTANQKPEPGPAPSSVDLLWELVRRQYPDARLDEAPNRDEIRGELETQLSRSKTLSSFPLANGDEPGFVFGAYRRN